VAGQASHPKGFYRRLPRWSNVNGSWTYEAVVNRWEENREQRTAMFGSSKAGAFKTLTPSDAWDDYMLVPRDLAKLNAMITHDADGDEYRLYTRFSLQDAAIAKFGDRTALEDAKRRRDAVRARRSARQRFGTVAVSGIRPRPPRSAAGTRAVKTAMAANSAIMCVKGVAAVVTGSGSMMSEAIHSAVDVMNQGLLAIGLARGNQPANLKNPYGFGHEMYAFSMLAGVGTFFLGSGVAIWHGIDSYMHPHDLEYPYVALAVLLGAGGLEGYTLRVAWEELKHEASKLDMGFKDYLMNGPDPINTAVFMEDFVAVSGVTVAGGGIALTIATGNPMYDALGSIGVGAMLGGVSCFLIRKNLNLLGQPVPARTEEVIALMEADPMVFSVQDVKSTQLRPGVCRLKAEVHFNPWALCDLYMDRDNNSEAILATCKETATDEEVRAMMRRYSRMYMLTLAMEMDRLETIVQKKYPEFRHIDLEIL